ncbi:SDR family oxidoreductase [Candidatus Woesearchaeota archaeon]|nr:SDR family oxidoreductase [Candidatus Woesearchaeota archaeon]
MRFLVTGGAGFIGSNIVEGLLSKGYQVKIIDNLSTGNLKNLSGMLDKIEFIEGDIGDLKLLKESFKDVDFVLHQAALRSVPRSIKEPIKTNEVNANGTLKVLVAARDAGVKRVVYASSSSVYGDCKSLPNMESMEAKPISPYAISKLVGEHYCRLFYDTYGLETVSLRYFGVFGPRQDPDSQYSSVIPLFIKAFMHGKKPAIFGDGKQTRDFTFVKNVVGANILACSSKNACGKVFNIACNKSTNLIELIVKIGKIFGREIKPTYTRPREGDVKHTLADISLAGKILGYKPTHSIDEGLKLTVDWYKNECK